MAIGVVAAGVLLQVDAGDLVVDAELGDLVGHILFHLGFDPLVVHFFVFAFVDDLLPIHIQ